MAQKTSAPDFRPCPRNLLVVHRRRKHLWTRSCFEFQGSVRQRIRKWNSRIFLASNKEPYRFYAACVARSPCGIDRLYTDQFQPCCPANVPSSFQVVYHVEQDELLLRCAGLFSSESRKQLGRSLQTTGVSRRLSNCFRYFALPRRLIDLVSHFVGRSIVKPIHPLNFKRRLEIMSLAHLLADALDNQVVILGGRL